MKATAAYGNITGIYCREEHTDRRFSFSFSIKQAENCAVFDACFFDREEKEIKICKAEISGTEFDKLLNLLRSYNAIERIKSKKEKATGFGMPIALDAPICKLKLEFSDGSILSLNTAVEFGGELKRAFTDIVENISLRLNV